MEACPPSAWYRLRKFARRNKGRLAAAAGVFLAVTAMAVTIGWAVRDRVAREAEADQAAAARRAQAAGQVRDALNAARTLLAENKLALVREKLAEARVLLGDGKGGFAAARKYATPNPAFIGGAVGESIGVGDFNHDGKLEIVTSGVRYGMSVLMGNGDGTFQSAQSSAVGLGKYLAVADGNGDGKLDLIGNNLGVKVLLGNGDGTFRAGFTYSIPQPGQVPGFGGVSAVGDLNRDGTLDLVTITSQSVGLMTGNGDGTFGAPQTVAAFPSSDYVKAAVVGDFSGDGKLDVAIVYTPSSGGSGLQVAVWTGNGDGTFSGTAGIGAAFPNLDPSKPIQLVAADVNHDGHLDLLALASGASSLQFQAGVALGGNGSFSGSSISLPPFSGPATAIATGDFNSDGYLDVAIVGGLSTGTGHVAPFLWKP